MTGSPKRARDALDRLADAFVEDILGLSDEEILAEMREDNRDPEKLADEMRTLFERTIQEEGKAKLAAAKMAVAKAQASDGAVVKISSAKRRRYQAMLAKNTELSKNLTMAAREGEGASKRNIDSMIDDLAELGAFDDEDGESE